MAGRGRGLTLPAWMTSSKPPASSAAPPVGAPPPPPPTAPPPSAPTLHTPGPSGATPSTAADWTEHIARDGRRYYFNKREGRSSWAKPAALLSPTEAALSATGWTKHTAGDGRVYYFHKASKRSVWTEPEEVRKARGDSVDEKGAARKAPDATPQASQPKPASSIPAPLTQATVPPPPSSAPPSSHPHVVVPPPRAPVPPPALGSAHYVSPAEAKAAFTSLLQETGCGSGWTWEETMRKIITDRRYGALRSLAEKKACFNAYVASLEAKGKQEREEREERARTGFLELIRERGATGRWRNVEGSLRFVGGAGGGQEEARFAAAREVFGLREMEVIFTDHVQRVEREEREAQEGKRREAMEAFKKLIEGAEWIDFRTQWRRAVERLSGTEEMRNVERMDALDIFQGHIRELERREEGRKHKEREIRLKAERENRDAFVALLAQRREDGTLTARSRWKDFVTSVKGDPVYTSLCGNLSGSTPRELFTDILEEVYSEYQGHKAIVRAAIKETGTRVTEGMTLEELKEKLSGAKGMTQVLPANLCIVHCDEVERAADRNKREARRRRRLKEDFSDLLADIRAITPHMPWEEARKLIPNEDQDLLTALEEAEEPLEPLYEEHVASLIAKEQQMEDGEIAEKSGGGGKGVEDTKERAKDGKRKTRERKRRKEAGSDEEEEEEERRKSKRQRSRSREKKTNESLPRDLNVVREEGEVA